MLAGKAPNNGSPVVLPEVPKPPFQVSARGDVTLITLAITMLDGAEARKLARDIKPHIPTSSQVIIDLGPAVFLDADGLNALWGWIETAQQRQTGIRLCNHSKSVSLLLQLTRVSQVVPVHSSTVEALRAIHIEPLDGKALHASA